MSLIPPDLVIVGHVVDAWGLKGGIRVAPYSPDADALLTVREWWLDRPLAVSTDKAFGNAGCEHNFDVLAAKKHGASITANLVGVVDRNAAERLKGARVAIPQSRFPALPADEFYWVDLIGLEVVNQAGEVLGEVVGLMDNGAHQILEVRQILAPAGAETSGQTGPEAQRLIPFVGQFVKTVDHAARRITVDWGLDY